MSKHLERDLDRLKRAVLTMGGMVEEATDLAISAIVDRRADLAERVSAGDDKIDGKELEIEDECLKMLALHQPVASDLRFIITVLKVNNDLERMGDLAKNIAERALDLVKQPPIEGAQDFRLMAERVRRMVHGCIDALVQRDVDLARKVCLDDLPFHIVYRPCNTSEDSCLSDFSSGLLRSEALRGKCQHPGKRLL